MKTLEELKNHFTDIEFSDKYVEIINYIRKNDDCKISIQGQAGSGKSCLLKVLSYMFSDDDDYNVAIASSTGVASALLNNGTNLGATTIHSLFKLQPKDIFGDFKSGNTYIQYNVISKIDCFIIDEVSMISADLYDYIMDIIRYCRRGCPTRIILFGDCLQLQCVIKEDKEEVVEWYNQRYNGNREFFSSTAFSSMKFQTFLLTKIYRQNGDDKFVEILNRIRVCEQTEEDLEYINQRIISEDDYILQNESFLRIVSTNKDVQKYNQIALDSIDGKYIVINAEITGTFKETTEYKNGHYPEKIFVKIGCPVMILRNGSKKSDGTYDYYNGSMGILVNCTEDYAMVDLGDKIVRVDRSVINNYEYKIVNDGEKSYIESKVTGTYENIMIKPCACSTIHKVQGLTLSKSYIDFGRWIPPSGVYVALSRMKSINDFGLRRAITMKDIYASQESLRYVTDNEYYENMYNELFEKD